MLNDRKNPKVDCIAQINDNCPMMNKDYLSAMGIPLWTSRSRVNPTDIIFLGDALDHRAELLFSAMLNAIDLKRDNIAILNASRLDHKPIATPPTLWVALGKAAGQSLLKTQNTLDEMRGKWHSYSNIPLRVTYHPTDLLQNPQNKRKALQDLQNIQLKSQEM